MHYPGIQVKLGHCKISTILILLGGYILNHPVVILWVFYIILILPVFQDNTFNSIREFVLHISSHESTVNRILESLEILLDELKVQRRFSHIHPHRWKM